MLSIDIREPKPDKILLLRNEKDKKVCIHSLSHPINYNKFPPGANLQCPLFPHKFPPLLHFGQVGFPLPITTLKTFPTGTSSSGCLIGDIWVWRLGGVVRYFLKAKLTFPLTDFFLILIMLHIKIFCCRFLGTAPLT